MANVKISNLPAESDVNNIIGFAGYNAAGTCKISGADLINTLPSSTPPLSDVLTAGNIVQDQVINIQTTSDIRNTRFDKNGISQSNFAADIILSQVAAGRIFLSTNNNDIVLQALGTGQVVFNTPEIALQSGDVLDSTSSAGSTGQVLSSLGAGNGTEWVAAGGPTPGIGDVLNTSQTTNSGQKINFLDGATVAEVSTSGIFAGGNFSIVQGGAGDILILGNATSPTNLLCGAGQISLGDTNNNINIATNGSDKIQLACNGTGEVEFYLGLNNTGPAIGDVLTAKSTAGAVEWTTPIGGAFSPIDVASSETAPTAATTQYYYQTIAGATMTISKAKLWGFQGTNTVLFGIYRGTFGSLTLIGQGSATCSTGPNVINLVAEPGQSLSVTAGEDIVVGFYPSGTSWRTIYDDGISDIAFGISNTANITSMPASPTGGASSVRFACTLY